MITSQDLKPFFENYTTGTIRKILKTYSYEHLFESTKHLIPIIKDKDIKERIYLILNDIKEIPTCKHCGNPVTFWSIPKGYHNYCSYSCSNFGTSVKRVETTRERYGDNAFNSSASWYKKSDEEKQLVKEGRKKTCLERFGVEYYLQTPEFRQATIKSAQEQYGVDYFTQAPEIREATKQTCIERYGYENQMQSPIIQQRSKDTCLERYGYEYASQHPDVWGRGLDTKFKKHGYYSPFELEHVQKKSFDTILKRYNVPNAFHVKNENRNCHSKISQELFWAIYNKLELKIQEQCYFGDLNREYILYYNYDNKLRYFFIDFCILSQKIVIEFQGDHWHKNPALYKENEENIKIWEKDKFKKQIIESQGFQVFYIWENDYRNNKEQALENIFQIITTNK